MERQIKRFRRRKDGFLEDLPEDIETLGGRLLTRQQAAGYFGVSLTVVLRLEKIGKLPVVYLGTMKPRYLLSDLDQCALECRRLHHQVWDENSEQLPEKIVERFLGLTKQGVNSALQRGALKDRTVESLCEFIKKRQQAELHHEIESQFRAKLGNRIRLIKKLREQIARLEVIRSGVDILRSKNERLKEQLNAQRLSS